MMQPFLTKILTAAGAPLCQSAPSVVNGVLQNDPLSAQVLDLLQACNGFFALEKALHIFPLGCINTSSTGYDLASWNSEDLWRKQYDGLNKEILFFSEDIFGHQFAIWKESIYKFNPETGILTFVGHSLEDWAALLVVEHKVETGWPIARLWQEEVGYLPPTHRLVPKIPFVAGGAYDLSNLFAVDAVEGMLLRANICSQIKNLPDGAQINIIVS